MTGEILPGIEPCPEGWGPIPKQGRGEGVPGWLGMGHCFLPGSWGGEGRLFLVGRGRHYGHSGHLSTSCRGSPHVSLTICTTSEDQAVYQCPAVGLQEAGAHRFLAAPDLLTSRSPSPSMGNCTQLELGRLSPSWQ